MKPSALIHPPRNLIMQLTFEVPEQVSDMEFTGAALNGVSVGLAVAAQLRATACQVVKAPPPPRPQ